MYQQADYFISAGDSPKETQGHIFRLLDLLFGDPFITPTFEEYAMFRAYVASLRSADLSRQIGVVVTKDHEILAEGVNDCPKAFGGLYWPVYNQEGEYEDEDNGRDYKFDGGYDSNKIQQKKIIIDILRKYLNSFSDNGFSYVSIGHIIKINNDANPLIISSKV